MFSDHHRGMMPVSSYYMTSFNYGGKKTRDIGLTCMCMVVSDSIFFDSIGSGMNWDESELFVFCFFSCGGHRLPQHREIDSVLSL